MNNYPSKLFEQAVHEFAKLPGIGKKTALRLILHILQQDENDVVLLGNSIIRLKNEIKYCKTCFNISEDNYCEICRNNSRDHSVICVVQDVRDVMAVENTGQFNGVYHILGGVISPMDGIKPEMLNIEQFVNRIKNNNITEVIFALPATIEGDTTGFYIFRKITDFNVNVSVIARGIPLGDELEYADEATLGRSIVNRTPYNNPLVK